MKPSIIMYIGILVAMFIVVWGVSVLYQRYTGSYRRKKADVSAMHTWVPLHSELPDAADDEDVVVAEDPKESVSIDLRLKSQQNGHYSESKPTL